MALKLDYHLEDTTWPLVQCYIRAELRTSKVDRALRGDTTWPWVQYHIRAELRTSKVGLDSQAKMGTRKKVRGKLM